MKAKALVLVGVIAASGAGVSPILVAALAYPEIPKDITKNCERVELDQLVVHLRKLQTLIPSTPPDEAAYLKSETGDHRTMDEMALEPNPSVSTRALVYARPFYRAWDLEYWMTQSEEAFRQASLSEFNPPFTVSVAEQIQRSVGVLASLNIVKKSFDQYVSVAEEVTLTNNVIQEQSRALNVDITKIGEHIVCLTYKIKE